MGDVGGFLVLVVAAGRFGSGSLEFGSGFGWFFLGFWVAGLTGWKFESQGYFCVPDSYIDNSHGEEGTRTPKNHYDER